MGFPAQRPPLLPDAVVPIYADPVDGLAVPVLLLQTWTARLVERVGTPEDVAADVAEVLVASDARGIASHGTARLPNYLALIEAGVMDPAARPVRIGGRPALIQWDARNGWGHHAGRIAVDAAIDASRGLGMAASVVRGTNHFGIAGWYALRAAAAGSIGIALSNTSPLVAPTRARLPLIGTNPIAIAAPAGRFGAFCLDMATSTIPRGRIEVAARRGEALPVGWAIDADGRPARTPEAALQGALHPLGGEEATGGHKGYGLSLAVDLLTGVLAGSAFGPNIVGLFSTEAPSNLGQTFIAIDPAAIDSQGSFERRLEDYLEQLVAAPTIPDAPGRVLVPGEPEANAAHRSAERGVVIDAVHAERLRELGERLDVPFPTTATT
jgi:LDH2 family malate/lactate/ureidoglycolate dehydrogenase